MQNVYVNDTELYYFSNSIEYISIQVAERSVYEIDTLKIQEPRPFGFLGRWSLLTWQLSRNKEELQNKSENVNFLKDVMYKLLFKSHEQ